MDIDERIAANIPYLLRYGRIFFRDENDNEDFCQEVIVRALLKKHTYDEKRASVFSWLKGFAVMILKEHKRKKREICYDPAIWDELINCWEEQGDDDVELLNDCLKNLKEKDLYLLKARYGESISIKEIAVRQKKKDNSIKVKLHRLRQILLRCIEEKGK